ncbi:hypothetical protein Bca52824_094090 [Brassica carinata]|uniref:Uncharacterized protein n=1 Tax=Brassica carinata TaxID=52824 RepID=A0A8X7P485_BRACI|nr:hypothetical protein Bca52824_094090 [Brassica carinata]
MQARMDTQQQRLDSLEGLLDVMAVGNPTLQSFGGETSSSRDEPAGSKRGTSRTEPSPTTSMTMMLAFSFLFNFFCFV